MKIRYLIIACLLISGCYDFHYENAFSFEERYPAEVNASVIEWTKVYDYKNCNPSEIKGIIAGPQQLEELCNYPDAGSKLGGCYLTTSTDFFVPDVQHYILFNEKSVKTSFEIIVANHEMMHYLANCSGDFSDAQDNHDDPLIWGAGGILEKTNSRFHLYIKPALTK